MIGRETFDFYVCGRPTCAESVCHKMSLDASKTNPQTALLQDPLLDVYALFLNPKVLAFKNNPVCYQS